MDLTSGAAADSLRQLGWVVVHIGLDQDLCERTLRAKGAEAMPDKSEQLWPRILDDFPEWLALTASSKVLEVIYAVGGDRLQMAMNYLHLKPRKTPAHTVPHSDIAHLAGLPDYHSTTLMFKCMIALTPVTIGSGGVACLSGSHRTANAPHAPTYVTMVPGDVLIFNAAILHSSTPNTSDRERWSVWCAYAQDWMKIMPGHEIDGNRVSNALGLTAEDPRRSLVCPVESAYATGRADRIGPA